MGGRWRGYSTKNMKTPICISYYVFRRRVCRRLGKFMKWGYRRRWEDAEQGGA